MKNIESYLDDLKALTGSDYQSAIALSVDRSVISKMRSRGAISDENAVKIAELIGIDPGEILLAAAMARSQGAVKSAWESVGKRAGIAAAVALVITLPQIQTKHDGHFMSKNVYYVKSNVHRTLARFLRWFRLFSTWSRFYGTQENQLLSPS